MTVRRRPRDTAAVVVATSCHGTADNRPQMDRDTAQAPPTAVDRVLILERQLETLSLRIAVTRLVFRDVSAYVDEDERVDRVVDDVLHRWQERGQNDAPGELGGPDGFWNRYANRVEFAPAGSENEYRPEFCPDEPARFDADDYFRAVWRAHIAGLPAAVGIGLSGR